MHPRGPLPPDVYWRRRAAVLAVTVVVLLLIIKVVAGAVMNDAAPSPSGSVLPLVTSSATPTEEVSPSTEPSLASTQPSASAESGTATKGVCAKSDISVAATVDRKTTKVGSGLHITLTVTNKGKSACKRDVGSGANEITVTSGSTTVWSSDYCNPSSKSNVVTLRPGKSWKIEVSWSGKVTLKGCDVRKSAKAGTYSASARNGTVHSKPARFAIR